MFELFNIPAGEKKVSQFAALYYSPKSSSMEKEITVLHCLYDLSWLTRRNVKDLRVTQDKNSLSFSPTLSWLKHRSLYSTNFLVDIIIHINF